MTLLLKPVPPARHLLRAKDLIDARYREPLDVRALARAAHLPPAHFSREFRRAFGETPHQYLLTRRLERAAALLRNTDYSVAEICFAVGLQSVGSFTTSFGASVGHVPDGVPSRAPAGGEPGPNPNLYSARVGPPARQQFSRRQSRAVRRPSAEFRRQRRMIEMLGTLTNVQVWVHDEDEALAFYTEKLGMELRDDDPVPELGNFRWLTVGVPGQPTSQSRSWPYLAHRR